MEGGGLDYGVLSLGGCLRSSTTAWETQYWLDTVVKDGAWCLLATVYLKLSLSEAGAGAGAVA